MITVARFGRHRLWSPETINDVLAISDRHVAAVGHSSVLIWRHDELGGGALTAHVDANAWAHGTTRRVGWFGEGEGARTLFMGRRDGTWCAISADDGALREVAESEVPPPPPHPARSRDGRWEARASIATRMHVIDTATGLERFPDVPDCGFGDLTFSDDGRFVLACTRDALIYALDDGGSDASERPRHRVPGVSRTPRLTVDGALVGARFDRAVARWDLDGTPRARVSIKGRPSMTLSADGRLAGVASIGYGGLCMWEIADVVVADLRAGRAVMRLRDPADLERGAAISPDGRWLVLHQSAAPRVRLVAVAPVAPFSRPVVVRTFDDAHGHFAGFLPDGRLLLADPDRRLSAARLPGGDPAPLAGATELPPATWLRFAHAAPLALEGCADCPPRVRFRDARTLAPLGEVTVARDGRCDLGADEVALSPDGARFAYLDGAQILVQPVPDEVRARLGAA